MVIGQEKAISKLSNAILRARAGVKKQHKPIGSFLFVGPTGVGKTYLAKMLTKELFDSEENLIRIDMSEYMEKHSISRLIGAPPGYVGYEEGGQLTEVVRRRPYSVLLLDEIEKANIEVFNLLLQLLDEGRLTDNKGLLVNFTNTVIIMTSNIGSEEIFMDSYEKNSTIKVERLEELLLKVFKPEFINRLDNVVFFNKLDRDDIFKVIELHIRSLEKTLSDLSIHISLSDKARRTILEKAHYEKYGARAIERIIKDEIETLIAKEIILENIEFGDNVVIDSSEEIGFYV